MTNRHYLLSMYRSNFPHGIMFHYFHSSGDDPKDQGSLSAEDFENILLFVGLENILPPDEWVFRLQNNRLRRSDICVTFDDGLRCQYDVCLPILEKYKIRCFWFVYSCVFEDLAGKLDIYRILRTRYFDSIDGFYISFFKKVEEQLLEMFAEGNASGPARDGTSAAGPGTASAAGKPTPPAAAANEGKAGTAAPTSSTPPTPGKDGSAGS